jgi:taurine dioxygenase
VREHPETGRAALYLCGEYVNGLAGMAEDESRLLYDFLRRRLDDPNLQCRWRWRPNDVAIWDERCTNHRGLSDHRGMHRLLRRCTVGASRPFGVGRGPASTGGRPDDDVNDANDNKKVKS